MLSPTVIQTAYVGDTMHSSICIIIGIMKDALIVEDNTLDINLASVARLSSVSIKLVIYDKDGNTPLEARLIYDFYIRYEIQSDMNKLHCTEREPEHVVFTAGTSQQERYHLVGSISKAVRG